MTRIAGRSSSRIPARRSQSLGGVGKTAAAGATTLQALEIACWQVARRGSLKLTLERGGHRSETVSVDLVARVELRRDERQPSDGDLTLLARLVAHGVGRSSASTEVSLRLGGWETPNGPLRPECLAQLAGGEIVLCFLERAGAPPLLLTDLPAQLGLRGGTYVLRGGAHPQALGELLA